MSDLASLESEINTAIAAAPDERALDAVRVGALGKKGSVSERMKALGTMSPEERKTAGPALNGLKERVTQALEVAARRVARNRARGAAEVRDDRRHAAGTPGAAGHRSIRSRRCSKR